MCPEKLSGNSDRPQVEPLQVGNTRPRSANFGHCALSMTIAEKPSGYFPDSFRETVRKARGALTLSLDNRRNGARKPYFRCGRPTKWRLHTHSSPFSDSFRTTILGNSVADSAMG